MMGAITKDSSFLRKYRGCKDRVSAAERAFEGALSVLSEAKAAGRVNELERRRNECRAAEEALHSALLEADALWKTYWSERLAEERERLMLALDHMARYNRIAAILGDAQPDPAMLVLAEARATGNASRGRVDDGEVPMQRPESGVLLDWAGAWR